MSTNERIERSGAAVRSKDLAAMIMTSKSLQSYARTPEGRAALIGTPQGRAAVARMERAAADVKTRAAKAGASKSASPYGGDRSYFRDLARVAAADARTNALIDQGMRPRLGPIEDGFPVLGDGDVAAARGRLDREHRYLMSTGNGAGFATYGWVGSLMDTAARIEGKLTDLVTMHTAPDYGLTLRVPVQTSPSVEAVTAEGTTITNTSITTSYQDSAVVMLAGEVEVTQALLDRGDQVDEHIAADLGRALALTLDQQILSGTGTGQLTGLLNLSGITETSYTDATPTVPEYRAAVWTLARDVQVASGLDPDTLVTGPTRHSWLWSGTASNSRQMLGIDLPAKPVAVGSVPTNLGAGTNEDRLLVWRKDRVHLHMTPVRFRAVIDDAVSGNLAVRLQAYAMAFLHVTRPSAVGVLKGTGCIVPTL